MASLSSWKRTLGRLVLRGAVRRAHRAGTAPREADWAKAMAAEFDHIASADAALSHALGCAAHLTKETIMAITERSLEPLFRWGVIGVATLWCAIKVTLLIQVSQPGALGLTGWLLGYNGAVAVLYGAGAVLAVRARYVAVAAVFVGIALLTASQFALSAWWSYEGHPFAMAIAAEDTIVWTLILTGVAAAVWLRSRKEGRSVI